uniref:Activin_recp domain-containing protein n=1 Tax=Rhabditophanes sp. KR3021 TaxID=114890 RepID=A0AC35TUP8_9BILA
MFALQCDQFMNINTANQHISSKKPYAVIQKCKACGVFESDDYDAKFRGIYIGCYDTTIKYAYIFGSNKVNFTETKDQCETNLKYKTPYCCKYISKDGQYNRISTFCCCNTDFCLRKYAHLHADNFQEILKDA